MKKLIIGLFVLFLLNSCESDNLNKNWELKYIIFYPNNNDTVIAINHRGFYWGSNNGTNYIKNGPSITSSEYLYNANSPYKIIYYISYELK